MVITLNPTIGLKKKKKTIIIMIMIIITIIIIMVIFKHIPLKALCISKNKMKGEWRIGY